MNLEKIIALLGQLQTVIAVLKQLPAESRKTVLATLTSNGLDVGLIARNVVKAKHNLQSIPNDNFEPLAAISSTHLAMSVREAISNDVCHKWGVVLYTNEYGAFMAVIDGMQPDKSAHKSITRAYEWARERGLQWIKFDPSAPEVAGLPCYEDGDVPLSENDLVVTC